MEHHINVTEGNIGFRLVGMQLVITIPLSEWPSAAVDELLQGAMPGAKIDLTIAVTPPPASDG